MSISDTNISSQTFTPFTGVSFINLSATAHVTHQPSTASVHWHHCSSSKHCCIVFQIIYSVIHHIQIWAIKAASYLARWIMRSRMQYAIAISRNYNCQVLQGIVEKCLRWGGETLWYTCINFLRNLTVKEFCKSVYICWNYDKKVKLFFDSAVYNVCILCWSLQVPVLVETVYAFYMNIVPIF